MTNRSARIIGSAIVAAAGGVTLGISSIANGDEAQVVGGAMLLIGGGMFLIDWWESRRSELKADDHRHAQ